MKTVWIVGYGFLGEAIADEFTQEHWKVIKIGRTSSADIHIADVSEADSLKELEKKVGRPDVVIHCASSGRGGEEAYEKVFERGAENLVKCFPQSKILFTSSSSVYPHINGELVDETSAANPSRETGKILRRSEAVILAAGGVVLRLSGIYGEGRSVILKKWLKHESTVEEDGRRMLNQIHRRDAASAFLLLAKSEQSGEIFNVSESCPKSQLQTLQYLADHYQRELPASTPRDMNRKRGWTHKTVCSKKLQSLGWQLRYKTFTDAVADIESSLS